LCSFMSRKDEREAVLRWERSPPCRFALGETGALPWSLSRVLEN
jgi:hypothetical protein